MRAVVQRVSASSVVVRGETVGAIGAGVTILLGVTHDDGPEQARWLANKELTGSEGLTVGRVMIKRGQQNPRHSHGNCQEILYLLAGRLEHSVGDEWVTLQPGDTIVVDAAVPHNARSVGDVDADMIVVYDSGVRHFQKES